ncbi:tRNA-specific 2-thiouridylase MnmA [Candidatus Syntrophocurvum alkaliphilum]|uniref:tRNA-specific 2-thiouridylase MnmA n=1 Tax=Candidatus Syntrophocurvum alkaliphilum TaxID=2293317 RepID=A0A6I6D8Q5_9FIRM|nr:tRNA 2-thiouridine(34) synthase MnmA [Candidatus Syntrophocurvum alkaliphilum]QGT98897.1 tRNA-specific 2-thiouridylase MnmA [Candidatus Syntrophocurvum alkaliphilum]
MKVAVLMSGGVDSTIVALLLKEQGYNIMGLTMINWDKEVGYKAQKVAAKLGIEHQIVDLSRQFSDNVVDYFCKKYKEGHTPNPCVECNRNIKFGELLNIAKNYGCDKVATGHYAQIEYDEKKKRYLLKKGVDTKKDQSYFLYALKQNQLSNIMFPLGDLTKEQVKQLAIDYNFSEVANSAESQEVCFITGDYRDFLSTRINQKSGKIIDTAGKLLGNHKGLGYYTIGQRKGLGISAGRPLYVIDLDIERNQLIVGDEHELYKNKLTSTNNNFIAMNELNDELRVKAKVRYRAKESEANIIPKPDKTIEVQFVKPQRAITPGQAVVFYDGDYVVGGGEIAREL